MIEISNLNFNYPRQLALFNDLTLKMPAGKIYGLLGKNGAGKTSLLKLIAGLVFPNQGECQVMQKTPADRTPTFLQNVFYLPEDLWVPAITPQTYLQNFANFYPRFDIDLYQRCIKEFELDETKLLINFSHGQKKKFLIAFGLATHCQLFILDEPTNGLDIPSKTQFRKLLASAFSEDKLFIISTHQVHDVENLIDSVVVVDQGKVLIQKDLVDITKKLVFSHQAIAPNPQDCLYSERQAGGFNTISYNVDAHDTQINLETFFNALLTQSAQMQKILNEVNINE